MSSLEQKLIYMCHHTPPEVVEKVFAEAKKYAEADFDVYAMSKPVLLHVEAAYKMLDRLSQRFETLQSSDCGENCLVIVLMRRIVEEEVTSLIEQISELQL